MSIPIPADRPVRVRIAPSPTGDPHVGTAYIGLFNMAFARHHGGRFVLRIEDTDRARSTRQSEAAIHRSLRWAGVKWDEGPDLGGDYGPYRQSERGPIYAEHIAILLGNGRAYRCFCTRERLDEVRAAQKAAGVDWRYDGHCRDLDPAAAKARADAGEGHVVRLRMPRAGRTVVNDALRGAVTYDNERVDDQVLLKSDAMPTYHLANVVDDHLMAITHVIRAEEWINSTPKHLELYDAFGWAPPVFIHMPLLRNADKSKISKRKNPTSIDFYRNAGILPEAFLNFLGMLGYSMADGREQFTLDEFVESLDLGRISLGGPVFDLAKLRDLNGKHIRALTPGELGAKVRGLLQGERADASTELVQQRVETVADYFGAAAFFHGGTLDYGAEISALYVGCSSRKKKAVWLSRKASRKFHTDVIRRLEAVHPWHREGIEQALRAAVDAAGVGVGDGFMAVRVAVTGKRASPGLFESIEVVGRSTALARLRDVVGRLANDAALTDAIGALQRQLKGLQDVAERAAQAQQSGGRLGPEDR